MVPFVIEHHLKAKAPVVNAEATPVVVDSPTALVFETCMRKISIMPWGESPALSRGEELAPREGYDLIAGPDAYIFLLEVLSGLQSPVFGETEVFSQFKNFWEVAQKDSVKASFFAPWAKFLFEDVKRIRSEFFRDSTTQTWGGVVRKTLRPFDQVWILGNGELAVSVAGSLKSSDVTYWARRMKAELNRPQVALSQQPPAINGRRALVVCAPLSNEEMMFLAELKGSRFDYVMDLREVQAQRLNFVDFDLKDIDSVSEIHHHRQQDILQRAQSRIVQLTEKTWDSLWHRPMGWEDLCG